MWFWAAVYFVIGFPNVQILFALAGNGFITCDESLNGCVKVWLAPLSDETGKNGWSLKAIVALIT